MGEEDSDKDTRDELYQAYNRGVWRADMSVLQSIEQRLERMENTLLGNGREGLVAVQAKQDVRITNVEGAVKSIEKSINGLKKETSGIRAQLGKISLGVGIALYALTGIIF
jgi:archaellum component FlaC